MMLDVQVIEKPLEVVKGCSALLTALRVNNQETEYYSMYEAMEIIECVLLGAVEKMEEELNDGNKR